MLTVGRHDNDWIDVMEKQIPNGVGYIRRLTEQMIYRNQLQGLEMLKNTIGMENSTYTEDDYLKDLRCILQNIGFEGKFIKED